MTLTTPDQVPPPGTGLPLDTSELPHRNVLRQLWRWFTQETAALRGVTLVAAIVPLAALVAILAVLAWKAVPAVKYNGLGFLTRTSWRPGNTYGNAVKTDGVLHPIGARYGALPLIVGTLASSAIAVVVRGARVHRGRPRHRREAPARISNGDWGVHGGPGRHPQRRVRPVGDPDLRPLPDARHRPDIRQPLSGRPGAQLLPRLRRPPAKGLLSAGLVLGVMIIPIVAATTRDLLRQVPRLPKEGALALGHERFRDGPQGQPALDPGRDHRCIRPRPGPGTGRDHRRGHGLGLAAGHDAHQHLPAFGTIASTIVQQLDGSLGDGTGFELRTLAEFALVLAVITLLANVGRPFARTPGGRHRPAGGTGGIGHGRHRPRRPATAPDPAPFDLYGKPDWRRRAGYVTRLGRLLRRLSPWSPSP